jgi:hypothetical protein
MSVTNAISSVIIVGAILAAGPGGYGVSKIFGMIGVILATINIFGGFIVANMTPIIPKIFETPYPPGPAARMAPTIITLEIAFVTLIKGLWSAGVTDQTT